MKVEIDFGNIYSMKVELDICNSLKINLPDLTTHHPL